MSFDKYTTLNISWDKKKQNKSKTTLLTHNAVVSILMESSENNKEK